MVEEVCGELVFEVDHGGLEFLVDVSCEVSQGFCGLAWELQLALNHPRLNQ
jgi:hypothetical protein